MQCLRHTSAEQITGPWPQHCDIWPTEKERNVTKIKPGFHHSHSHLLSFFSSLDSHLSFPLLCYGARLNLAAVVVSGRHFVVILHNKGLHANTVIQLLQTHLSHRISRKRQPDAAKPAVGRENDFWWHSIHPHDRKRYCEWPLTWVYICEWFWGCHTIKHTEGGRFRTIYNSSQV